MLSFFIDKQWEQGAISLSISQHSLYPRKGGLSQLYFHRFAGLFFYSVLMAAYASLGEIIYLELWPALTNINQRNMHTEHFPSCQSSLGANIYRPTEFLWKKTLYFKGENLKQTLNTLGCSGKKNLCSSTWDKLK